MNKAILDQGWFEFRRQLEYKELWRGGRVVLVPPQTCPSCDYVSADNRQSQARFICCQCGYEENADLVGAMNILAAGHAVSACGEVGTSLSMKQGTTYHRSPCSLGFGNPRPSGRVGCQAVLNVLAVILGSSHSSTENVL